ncbi:MAG: Rad52/Rad22 family DNA repair protein, partial [Gemmatimonadales bacterium]
MNRELLEKPFDPEQIRRRQGRNGMLDYVEGHSVIQRLNDSLESAWSFEITHHELKDDEVIVLGRLTAGTVSKMAFGTSQVTRERDSRRPISLGDDLKSAATDALKKCATFLGVGLHLYADKPLAANVPRPGHTGNGRPPVTERAAAAPTPTGPPPSNGHRPDGATERQLDTILKIGRARGLRPADLEGMSTRAFGRKPGQLTRAEASTLIKELTNLRRQ